MWNYDYRILKAELDSDDYYDGDTFSATLDNGRRSRFDTRIRLGDIDTWEVKKPRGVSDLLIIAEHKRRGRLAKEAMAEWVRSEMAAGNTVWVRSLDINEFDNFGRLLGAVYSSHSDGTVASLGVHLHENGHAKYELTHEDLA